MRVLLGFAALAATSVASPVQAQKIGWASSGVVTDFGAAHHDGTVHVHRGRGESSYGYPGYVDYGGFDANRSFDPDKWNDWWHDRPERAYPRWLSRNKDCARPWYSADVLVC